MRESHIYIMAGRSDVLYAGVTSDLKSRVHQHKRKTVDGFTKKYNLTSLVYYEAHADIRAAIAREQQIKGWSRSKKITLI